MKNKGEAVDAQAFANPHVISKLVCRNFDLYMHIHLFFSLLQAWLSMFVHVENQMDQAHDGNFGSKKKKN